MFAGETPDLSPDPFDARFWGAVSAASMAGQVVTSQSASQLDVVQSVLGRLGGAISTLPMQVFRRTGGDTREVATDHPLYKILHRQPTATMTAQLFRDQMTRDLAWTRNALALIDPADDGGPIGSLDWISWGRVARVYRGSDGRVDYDVNKLPPLIGHDTYRADEVFHIRMAPLSGDGLVGMPVWQTSRETLGDAQAVRQFGALYFANGGAGGGVIELPGTFKTTDDRDAFMSAWRSAGGGLNQHKDRLLLQGATYKKFAINNDEAQFNETVRAAELRTCRIWNMPPHMIGIVDSSNRSTTEQQSLEFVMYTLAPWVVAWEQAAAQQLLVGADQDDYFIELNVAGLLRGDIKTRWSGYGIGRQWGWLSVNDIRRLENLDPIGPEGDRYLEPVNMTASGNPGGDNSVQVPDDDGPDDDKGPSDGTGDPEETD